MKKKGLLKTAVFMVFAIFLSKVCGLLRDILLAKSYGTSIEAIAFDTGSRLPILLFDFLIGGVITAAFIPIFNEILVKESKEKAMKFADSYMTLISFITGIIAIAGILFAPFLVSFLAPDITAETRELAISLTRIMFPMIFFTGIAFSFVGILQSLGEFNLPAVISLISNGFVVMYFLFFNDHFGIYGLSVFYVLGWAVQAFVQIPKARSLGYRYHFNCNFTSPYIKSSLLCALPILISSCTQPLCTLINTRFASSLNEGRAITDLSYASKLYIIVVGIFSFVATNLLFPMLSRASASGNKDNANQLVTTSSKLLVFVIAPISAGFIALSKPFITIVYQRGAFNAEDSALTAEALKYFAVGMIFMAVNEVLTKAFFSQKNTKTPMITAIISMLVNFALVSFLSQILGIGGIAFSTAIATIVNCVLNYLILSKKGGATFNAKDFINMLKAIVASVLMGVCVFFIYNSVSGLHLLLSFSISVVCGMLIYFIVATALRTEEMIFILNKLKKGAKC